MVFKNNFVLVGTVMTVIFMNIVIVLGSFSFAGCVACAQPCIVIKRRWGPGSVQFVACTQPYNKGKVGARFGSARGLRTAMQ